MTKFRMAYATIASLALVFTSGCLETPPVETPEVDLQTQLILAGMNGLEGKELSFEPDGTPSYYSRIVMENVTEFMFDPMAGAEVDFTAGNPSQVDLTDPAVVTYYGTDYGTVFISSDGWISFGAAGNTPVDIPTHFMIPQISALPVDALLGGTVTVQETATELIVSFVDVPTDAVSKQEGEMNSFQVIVNIPSDTNPEQVVISYLDVDTMAGGVVGLSNGQTNGLDAEGLARFMNDFMGSTLEMSNMNTGNAS